MAIDYTELKTLALELILSGGLPAEIAKELGVAVQTVYLWCSEDGTLTRLRQARYLGAVNDYQNTDKSLAVICAQYNVSQTTIYKLLAVAEIPLRRSASTADETAEVLRLYDEGLPMYLIQAKTGKGYPFIYTTIDASGRERRARGRPVINVKTS